jgi:hypothetical protein
MSEGPKVFRWLATVTYRSDSSPIEVEHQFEEIADLHDLVERGPDWNTMEAIVVRLNPHRATHPGDTIERAYER